MDFALNQLTATIPPNLLQDTDNLITTADVESGKKLISVRVKILEIFRGANQETGAALEWQNYPASMGIGSTFADTLSSRRDWGDRSEANGAVKNLAEYLSAYRDAATFKVGAWGIDDVVARLRLTAYDNDLKEVSESDVSILEGQEATIKIGSRIPIDVGGGFLRYEDSGLTLTVKPQMAKEGNITLDVNGTRSTLTAEKSSEGINFQRNTEVKTSLSLINGDTGRLGGLLTTNELVHEDKIPILGDLPLFGFLFKSSKTTRGRTELVVLLSPSIVEDVPPHGRRSAGISALVAWLKPGTTDVVLDWSEDVPTDNVGIFRYKVYRDVRPVLSANRLAPVADTISRGASSWTDEAPKKRGATYYYAVTAVDGAGNEQAVSNSPAITIPRR